MMPVAATTTPPRAARPAVPGDSTSGSAMIAATSATATCDITVSARVSAIIPASCTAGSSTAAEPLAISSA